MMNGRAHEFRKEQVYAVFDPDVDSLVEARSRIEDDQAVRRRPEDPGQCSGRVLEPARQRSRPSGIGHGAGQAEVKAVRRRDRSGMVELGQGAADCEESARAVSAQRLLGQGLTDLERLRIHTRR
jgi:hypothetical protein